MASMINYTDTDCQYHFPNATRDDMESTLKAHLDRLNDFQASAHDLPVSKWYYGMNATMGKLSSFEITTALTMNR
jgi:hypothetical protein